MVSASASFALSSSAFKLLSFLVSSSGVSGVEDLEVAASAVLLFVVGGGGVTVVEEVELVAVDALEVMERWASGYCRLSK